MDDGQVLSGKVALVTGGGSGIGRATAARLARAGAEVVVADLDAVSGRGAASEVSGRFFEMDVAEPSQWEEAIAFVEGELGGLDIACLNAGLATGESDVTLVSDTRYRRLVATNVDGVFYGTRAVVAPMQRRGGGAVVATASLAGLIAYSPDPVYALTKHAVIGLVRALAPQLEKKVITINAVCPGLVDTPLLGKSERLLIGDFPLISPDAVAEAVLGCVTGATTGGAWVCQFGREALSYRFAGVPGPGGPARGRIP